MYEVIRDFYSLDLLKGINHKLTTSSLAMSVFRQKFLNDTVLYKLTPDKEAFVRNGYYGGRIEIFKLMAEEVNEYDVNAMYVSVMLENLPCESSGLWTTSYDFNDPETCGFIDCFIDAQNALISPCCL